MTTTTTAGASTGPVLVGYDFSEAGDEALRQGDAWAKRHGARLSVVHATVDVPRIAPLFPHVAVAPETLLHRIRRELGERLAGRVHEVTGRGPDDVEVVVELDSPHALLVRKAAELGARVAVVGTAVTGIARMILGSTAEQVVRHAACPVLVARPSKDTGLVLCGTDLSGEAMPAIVAAVEEARARGDAALVVHVLDVAHPVLSAFEPAVVIDDKTMATIRDTATQTLQASIESLGAAAFAEPLVVEGPPATTLVREAEGRAASLVVVGTHGRTGLGRLLALGSVAEAVARRAPCSVLVVRDKA